MRTNQWAGSTWLVHTYIEATELPGCRKTSKSAWWACIETHTAAISARDCPLQIVPKFAWTCLPPGLRRLPYPFPLLLQQNFCHQEPARLQGSMTHPLHYFHISCLSLHCTDALLQVMASVLEAVWNTLGNASSCMLLILRSMEWIPSCWPTP